MTTISPIYNQNNIIEKKKNSNNTFIKKGEYSDISQHIVDNPNKAQDDTNVRDVLRAYALCSIKYPAALQKDTELGQMLTREGKLFNRHTTCFARDDLSWSSFGHYLKERFSDIKDVDINVFGCSTGEEPYTLAMLLKKEYGDTPFTIHAMDISNDVIAYNNYKDEVILSKSNVKLIANGLDIRTMEDTKRLFDIDGSNIKLKKDITDSVQFSRANILESLDKIRSDKPSLIFCRNMWPYIDPEEYDNFAQKLYQKLAPGSVVVLGEYDINGESNLLHSDEFPESLIENGFKPAILEEDVFTPRRRGLSLIYEKN